MNVVKKKKKKTCIFLLFFIRKRAKWAFTYIRGVFLSLLSVVFCYCCLMELIVYQRNQWNVASKMVFFFFLAFFLSLSGFSCDTCCSYIANDG
ncbi:hypothetical protein QBC41DRAFT_316095 [Cercophora samala]|uniref:Uncharacterized protein n=1 Tax=Cercophora samala TaxID=330535 RepID=A0AA40DC35_9PEZI|nr:hypothetical protein QBC41DRAFT_316095 [Cercophora samala]